MTDPKPSPTESLCGDNGCIFGPPSGMGTNGGCRCLKGLPTMQRIKVERRVRQAAQLLRELAEDRERLDWLESRAEWYPDLDCDGEGTWFYDDHAVRPSDKAPSISGTTPREAIDAARKAQRDETE